MMHYNKRWGFLARLGSFWIGMHYSSAEKRYCINFVPCITLWIIKKDGNIPTRYMKK
jgi:hypothetical protein